MKYFYFYFSVFL